MQALGVLKKYPGAEEVPCANSGTGPISIECVRETSGCIANRRIGSATCPANRASPEKVLDQGKSGDRKAEDTHFCLICHRQESSWCWHHPRQYWGQNWSQGTGSLTSLHGARELLMLHPMHHHSTSTDPCSFWKRETSSYGTWSGLEWSYATFPVEFVKDNDSSVPSERRQLQDAKWQHSPNQRATCDLTRDSVPKQTAWPV